MNRKRAFGTGLIPLFVLLLLVPCLAQVNPWDMVKRMGRGINIGNTLDAPDEGRWAAPVQEYYFDGYRDAGFTNVRIPVRWDNHLGTEPPYTIDAAWMDRVEQVVDWALARGLVVIINSHHDDWLYANFPEHLPRFESLWRQVSERFKDKPDELLFEIINEPYFKLSEAQVDTLNARILQIIRETNPHRIVILTGGGENSYKAVQHIHAPPDSFLMAYFHYYLPWSFTNYKIGTWGDAQDRATMDAHFDLVKSWSEQHNIPILLGEFGVSVGADRPSLLAWYGYAANGAIRRGFAFSVWDAGPKSNKFTYYREPGLWDEEQLNVLTDQHPWGGEPWPVPGTVQAEDYDRGGLRVAYGDADTVNRAGYYRQDGGVEIDTLSGGGYAAVLDDPGDWAEYTFRADTSGWYAVSVRAGAEDGQKSFFLRFNGNLQLGPFSGLAQAAAESLATVTDSLFLTQGVHVFRLASETGGVRVDRIRFVLKSVEAANLLENPGFESGLQSWQIKQCTAAVVDSPAFSGQHAVLISNRKKEWAGLFQNIRQKLLDHGPGYYLASGNFRTVSDTAGFCKVKVRLTYGGVQHHIGAPGKVGNAGWTALGDTLLLTWSGPLQDANFFIQGTFGYTGDFYADDVSLVFIGPVTGVSATADSPALPERIGLANYPNPFNPATTIYFRVRQAGKVDLSVFDLNGRRVAQLLSEHLLPGGYQVVWNGRNAFGEPVASGCYFAVLKTRGSRAVHKMLLLR